VTKKLAPIHPTEAPKPVTVDLFASYAEAKASSSTTAGHATQILALKSIDGPDQEAWVAERGREIAAARSALDAQLKTWLKPVRELEVTIKGFASVVFEGKPTPIPKLLERCSKHLADLLGAARARAAVTQAALLPAARSAEEVSAALAVLQPKPAGFVEVEHWSWEIADIASIPHTYFVLDVARLDAEASEQKGAMAVPGIRPVCTKKGHFRS
jgi:hypothetical protein